jgi:hypothetical protein
MSLTKDCETIVQKLSSSIATPPMAACPHLVFRDIFGKTTVAELLSYVADRQADFAQARVRNRISGEGRVDYGLRNSLSLGDLGPFRALFETYVRATMASAITGLGLTEPAVEPHGFEIIAYPDGSRFGAHIDTDERLTRVRVLSCVYYFAVTPPGFSGGELRLYGLPTLSGGPVRFIEIVPETDTMVVFPSWLRHEVRPVRVPSAAWLDGRFTLNCWLHRSTLSPVARPS